MQNQSSNLSAAGQRRVWIVAGGPSARGFDFSVLDGERILAVNDAVFNVPQAYGVVSIDRDWQINRIVDLIEYRGHWFLMRRVGEVNPTSKALQRVRCEYCKSLPGLSDSWAAAHTMGSSGYAALNIAYLMRPQFIGLIGYDYDASGRHWYDDEKKLRNKKGTWATWAAAYDTTVAQLQAAQIEVINFSEHSKITAFPRRRLETIGEYVEAQTVLA